jgi:RimJ/RimL family protein N-acetyltransferase
MILKNVYEQPDRHWLLFELLLQRDEGVNISHREMPRWCDHVKFVDSKPYEAWYAILSDYHRRAVGACYLSKQNEIGVGILKEYQGQGYGNEAVRALMDLHGKRRYLANINPHNERSAKMFKDLGFNLIQHTYEAIA